MRGYWNNPEETTLAFRDRLFRTGDIGYQDADGYLYILDRLKDMIVTGGENVYSGEVEAVIYEHPAVREAAVFGIPDPAEGGAAETSSRTDLEGLDTGRYFTDDRSDYARQLHEGVARGLLDTAEGQKQLDQLLRGHIVISEEERVVQVLPFAGWTPHNRRWYLDQHDLTDDTIPSARSKRPGTPAIYVEHRPFLFGAGNDHHRYFLTADGEWTENSHKARTKGLCQATRF
jgi:acyl-CoA synthetase (AMP-forming)/AMP-acid ligase II